MSKILVIEDWIRFGQAIETCLVQFTTVQDSMKAINRLLRKHELDVIGFEAEVKIWECPVYTQTSDTSMNVTRESIRYVVIPKSFQDGDKLQVFVVRKKGGKEDD